MLTWFILVLNTCVQVLWFGQDLPHGNYAALRRMGSLPPPNTGREYLVAVRNYRTWVLTALYAFSFGVELTMNNGEGGRGQVLGVPTGCAGRAGTRFPGTEGVALGIAHKGEDHVLDLYFPLVRPPPPALSLSCAVFAQYVYDNFGTSLTAAGALASVFGLTNIVSRPAGGWLSDAAAHRCAGCMHAPAGLGAPSSLQLGVPSPLHLLWPRSALSLLAGTHVCSSAWLSFPAKCASHPPTHPLQIRHARPSLGALPASGLRGRFLLRPVADGRLAGRHHGHGCVHGRYRNCGGG